MSVGRPKAGAGQLGSAWAEVGGAKGLLEPSLAPVPWPLPAELSRQVVQRVLCGKNLSQLYSVSKCSFWSGP